MRAILSLLALASVALAPPASARAALMHFGSALAARASLTTNDLHYRGINTRYGAGVVHTAHFGTDTALWNTGLARGQAAAPGNGQVIAVSIEGCAVRPRGAPPPLTAIHLQTLVPAGHGAARVALTSQAFHLPVCGRRRAGASTISTYRPAGLCIGRGDYVSFNDEGGFAEPFYRSGVPYKVIAPARGSQMDSFLLADGTGNGATLSPTVLGAADGFAANRGEELLLRATLATAANARSDCRRGVRG